VGVWVGVWVGQGRMIYYTVFIQSTAIILSEQVQLRSLPELL